MSRQREDKLSLYRHVRSGEEAWRKRGTDEWKEVPVTPVLPAEGLEVHALAEIFPLIEGAAFDELVADIKANGLRERVDLYQDKIVEGRNRYRALQQLGLADRPDFYRNVLHAIGPKERIDDETIRAYVISKNIHRRHLTSAQKRAALEALIRANPEKSDRQIAAMANVDHKTAGAARSELVAGGEIPHHEERTDAKGVKQPAKKKKPTARAPLAKAKDALEANPGVDAKQLKKLCGAPIAECKKAIKQAEQDAERARQEAETEELAADLHKAGFANRVRAVLWLNSYGFEEALEKVLAPPAAGNDVDPEAAAEKRKQEMAALDGA
jgi:hypothetical protein